MNIKMAHYLWSTKSEMSQGRYKYGETEVKNNESIAQAVHERVAQQNTGHSEKAEILSKWMTKYNRRNSDNIVRKELSALGYRLIREGGGSEWIESLDTDTKSGLEELLSDINLILKGKKASYDFLPRREQQEGASFIVTRFKNNKATLTNRCRVLLAAKMRYGKTFTTLNAVVALGWKKVLILTYTPEALQEWVRQISTHINFVDMHAIRATDYSSVETITLNLPEGKSIALLFASAQDMLNYKTKEKWFTVRNEKWDGLIFDEFDFGGLTPKANELLNSINTANLIAVTGTAFNPITRQYFKPENIYDWGYEDEQKAKREEAIATNGMGEVYKWLPDLHFLVPKLGQLAFDISKYFDEKSQWSFNKFFHVGNNRFEHEGDVREWIKNLYHSPQSPIRKGNLKHMLWFCPNRPAAKALSKLLEVMGKEGAIPKQEIREISGGGEHEKDSLRHVFNAVKNKSGLGSVTLTVDKYSRGVSIPEWDSVFMLYHGVSASNYFQRGFRGQTSWQDGQKNDCYIVDWDLNRILYVSHRRIYSLYKYSREEAKAALKTWFDSAPVLQFSDTAWKELTFEKIWDQTKEVVSFHNVFTNSYIASMVNSTKFDENAIYVLQNLAKSAGKKFKEITTQNPKKILEHGEEQAGLKNTTDSEETSSSQIKEENEEQTILMLSLLAQDIIKDVVKFAFVSPLKERGVADVIATANSEDFKEFTSITIEQFAQLVKSGIIQSESLDETLIALSEEEF